MKFRASSEKNGKQKTHMNNRENSRQTKPTSTNQRTMLRPFSIDLVYGVLITLYTQAGFLLLSKCKYHIVSPGSEKEWRR